MLEKISYEESQVKNYRIENYFKRIRKTIVNLIRCNAKYIRSV